MQWNTRAIKITGITVAVILVILLALPLFINVNSFRPKIESELTSALGRKVTLGDMSLSIIRGSVSVKDVSIADDPSFNASPFVTAKSLQVGVKLLPLIFSKELSITKIVLDEPQITLLKKSNGTWNFSSLGGNSKKPSAPEKSSSAQNLSIGKLEIKDGKLAVGQSNSTAKPQVYDKLDVELTDLSATSQFPFEVQVGLPGGGNAKLSGKAGPINSQDAAKTPLDATLKVSDFDLAASGFVDPASGIAGVADINGTLTSDGKQGKAVGSLTAKKLKFSPKGTPGPQSLNVKYAMNMDLDRESGTVTQGDIALGKVTARLTGGYQTQGNTQVLNMKLSAPNMSVDELESMLPAFGIVMPSGSKLKGGTLSADLSITGPLDRLVIAGPVRMANSKLAGFDMGAKLGALSAFTGKAKATGDTTIQNASLNAHIAPEITRADAINVTIPSLGVVTGAGTISPAGALDFRMLADLETQRSEARTDRRGRSDLGGVAFRVQGTTSNPTFVPDVGSIAGNAAKGAISGAVSEKTGKTGLGGVFGRKK